MFLKIKEYNPKAHDAAALLKLSRSRFGNSREGTVLGNHHLTYAPLAKDGEI